MNGSYLAEVQQTYTRRAGWYDEHLAIISLGQEQNLRRRYLGCINLRPGDTVLDVACGTGLNFGALQSFIGPKGRIIGFDCTEAMLTRARDNIQRYGWRNVELCQGDAMELHIDEPVNAAICTFAIGLMPDPSTVLSRMVEVLKPGGALLIADGQLSARWFGPLLNPILRLVGLPWLPPYSRQRY